MSKIKITIETEEFTKTIETEHALLCFKAEYGFAVSRHHAGNPITGCLDDIVMKASLERSLEELTDNPIAERIMKTKEGKELVKLVKKAHSVKSSNPDMMTETIEGLKKGGEPFPEFK